MRILDTHLHLIHPDRFAYPWVKGVPALNRAFPAETYWSEAAALGIEAALHMEVDVAEEDREAETTFALALHPRIVGAIAACRPESPDFPAELERLAALHGVRGLRRILHTMPDALSQSDLFAQNLRRLPPFGLSFDICVLARQLPLARALAVRCPDVSFILDHCGNPDIAGGSLDGWSDEIEAIAALPNVAVKVSGLVSNAGPEWTTADLRPFIEHVIGCFGWERVVWGSDFPVCTLNGTLTRWVEGAREIVSGCSTDEQDRLFSRNATRIYRLN